MVESNIDWKEKAAQYASMLTRNEDRLDFLEAENKRLRDLLRRTLDVVTSDEFAGPFVISCVHGMEYQGPVIPVDEIREALGSVIAPDLKET